MPKSFSVQRFFATVSVEISTGISIRNFCRFDGGIFFDPATENRAKPLSALNHIQCALV